MSTATAVTTSTASPTPAATMGAWQYYAVTLDRETRDRLICQYAPLVKYVVGRMRLALPPSLDYDDILGYGTVGLIEAVDRFDPNRGIKFETYAIPRIRGAIIDAIRALDIIPRRMRERARAVEQVVRDLFIQNGSMPSDELVASQLGVSVDHLQRLIQETTCTMLPLQRADRDDTSSYEEVLADESALESFAEVLHADAVTLLTWALDKLSERDRLVITLYYYEELTMKEVSEVLGVTESRVSQLLARARLHLRALLQAQGMSLQDLPV
jgi:RNA polymerase sigma factor for flagellar operon FliA